MLRTNSRRNRMGISFFIIIFFLGLATNGVAQSEATTARIEGLVTDESGGVVPGAEVTVRNLEKGWTRTLHCGSDGWYAAPALEVGRYEVLIAHPGFNTARFARVELTIGQTLRLDATLHPATVTQVVTVTEVLPLIETSKTESSTIVSSRQIADLPINGRRFTDFVLLTPGVTTDPRGLTGFNVGDLSFGGLRGVHNNIQIDGADNNNAFFQQARGRFRAPYQVSQDAVSEFRVLNSNYSAEYGRAGGAIVNVITKSGSNQHRGDVFYFIRDSSVAARHPTAATKLQTRQQQFGVSVGGPLVADKLFYFGNFDQQIFHIPQNARLFCRSTVTNCQSPNVFTAAEVADPQLNSPLSFLGGMSALDFLRSLHSDFVSSHLAEVALGKLDWHITSNEILSGRYNVQRFRGSNNTFFDQVNPLTNFAANENGGERVHTDSVVVSLLSVLSPSVLNEARYQFARDNQFTSANSTPPLGSVRDIIFGFGRSSILPRNTFENRHQIIDNLTWTHGVWTFRTGIDLNFLGITNFFPGTFGGSYAFEGMSLASAPSTCVTDATKAADQVYRFACNEARTYSQNVGSPTSFPDTKEFGVYGQASWQATRRLTWNFGLRYEVQTFAQDRLRTNPAVLAAGFGDTGRINTDKNNFGPRVGTAYALTGDNKTVLRAGYGIFYSRTPQIMTSTAELGNGLVQKRFRFDRTISGPPAQGPCIPQYPNILDPVALFNNDTSRLPAGCTPGALTSDIFKFADNFVEPYVQQWSLALERVLPGDLVLSASYLGLKGTHLNRSRDVNLARPTIVPVTILDPSGATLFTATLARFLSPRPLGPPVGAINVYESAASSTYHAFVLTANKRLSHGIQFLATYTLSKSIDDGQDALIVTGPGRVQNTFDPRADRGPSVTDQRHRFVLNWIYEPQVAKMKNAALRHVLGDWRFSSIATIGSGRPVDASVSGDPNKDGNFSNDRTAGFGRNAFTLPGFKEVDLRVNRGIRLTETKRLEFIAEFFNLFNHVNQLIGRSDDGFFVPHSTFSTTSTPATCVAAATTPCYRLRSDFPLSSSPGAYGQRQIEFAVKFFY
jgi:outer membrane receptor protein involved in Fe transport